MDIAVYKNIRKYFEKLEELFHKYHIAPDRYAVTFLPGINDYEKAELYVMNNYICISPVGANILSDDIMEYEPDNIMVAGIDFIKAVVSNERKQKKIIYEYMEWENFEERFCGPLALFTLEESKAKEKHVVPFFIEGHDFGASFWIFPVVVNKKESIGISDSDVEELHDRISIDEEWVNRLLYNIFSRFFDSSMQINRERINYHEIDRETGIENVEYVKGFDSCLAYNFYTYEQMGKILSEIDEYADCLSAGVFTKIDKKTFAGVEKLFAKTDKSGDDEKIKHSYYMWIARFYKDLSERIRRMMKKHPETDVISIMGP